MAVRAVEIQSDLVPLTSIFYNEEFYINHVQNEASRKHMRTCADEFTLKRILFSIDVQINSVYTSVYKYTYNMYINFLYINIHLFYCIRFPRSEFGLRVHN